MHKNILKSGSLVVVNDVIKRHRNILKLAIIRKFLY